MISPKKIAASSLVLMSLTVAAPLSVLAMDSTSGTTMMASSMSSDMVSVPKAFIQQIVTLIQSILAAAQAETRRTDTKAADLRVLLNALERQHVDLASAAVRAGFDAHASFDKAAAELDKNSVAISDAIGSVYGDSAKAPFLAIWRSHIGFFVDYTLGAKAGDKVKMDKAVKDLTEGYVPAIADFLSKANPNLPRAAVAQLVTQHVLDLKAAVDAYGAGDYATSYSKQTEAYNQIGSIADALSGAIVKQFPDNF